jgi:hypothetical protein
VQRGGGDPHNIKDFNPIQFIPTPNEQLWLDEIVQQLIPDIVEQHKQVCEEYSSTKSHQERKTKRLTTIKGMLGSVKNDVEHLVMMMASPLVDPDTYLLDTNNTRSLWEIYHNDILSPVLNLPAFQLDAFVKLQQSVLVKMKARHDYSASFSRESKCAMEKFISDNVRWIRTLKTMVSSSPSPPPGFQPQQQIDLIDLTGVMVTTIELVIGIFNWKLNLLRKVILSETD